MRTGAGVRLALLRVVVFVLGLALGVGQASAQELIDKRKEYNVKAVSLYAFGRYVTWPESSFESESSEFLIGVMGPNPFSGALSLIAQKKTIQGRPIRIWQVDSPEQAARCHILFVTSAVSEDKEASLLSALDGKTVLVVGESPGFARRGGAVNFYVHGNNVRFELNADRAMASRLSLNAKMHSLGTPVTSHR